MSINVTLAIDSIIPLIEIVVQEYRLFQNQESLHEFQEFSNLITNIVERSNVIILKINLLLLQGKIAVINGEGLRANSFYTKSLALAEEFQRVEVIPKIKSELAVIEKLSSNFLINVTPKERFDMIEMENYLKDAFKFVSNLAE